jgi:hypothetical protein
VQQQGGWRTKQRFATWHHREFNELPPLWLISQPTNPGHRLTANCIHQHPAPGAAVIKQILTAAIENLTKLGRDGGLFEVPQLGSGMSIQGQQFKALAQGRGRALGLPAPESIPPQRLETLLS